MNKNLIFALFYLGISVCSILNASTNQSQIIKEAGGLTDELIRQLQNNKYETALQSARSLQNLLKGQGGGSGETLESCRILNHIYQYTKIYDWTDSLADPSQLQLVKKARRALCTGAIPSHGAIRYPNGQIATRQAGSKSSPWYYPNGKKISNYPTKDWSWYYPNGKKVASYPTNDWTWYYPNGRKIANYPNKDWTWYYSNGTKIANYPTKDWTWYYPNGKKIANYLTKDWTWYYPDGSTWMQYGMNFSTSEWSDIPSLIEWLLKNSGWSDQKSIPSLHTISASPQSSRKDLEENLIKKLGFIRDQAFPRSKSSSDCSGHFTSVGDFLKESEKKATQSFCYGDGESELCEFGFQEKQSEFLIQVHLKAGKIIKEKTSCLKR